MYSVLIVDNEAIIRKGLRMGFDWQSMGCTVIGQAAGGEEALEKMEAQAPDILISDIRMPGMDGLELTRAVRSRFPHTKVILVTAFSEFEYAQEALHQQVTDFIIKPTSREKMRAAVARATEQLDSEQKDREILKTLKQKHEDNLLLRQQLFLEGVLSGRERSKLYVLEESERLGLRLQGRRAVYIRVVSGTDDESALCGDAEELKGYCARVFGETPLFLSAGENAVMLVAPPMEARALSAALEEISGLIDGMTEFGALFGVSGALSDAAMLPRAAQEARDACSYLDYDAAQTVMLYENIPQVSEEGAVQLRLRMKELSGALRALDRDAAFKALCKLDTAAREEKFPPQEMRRCMALLYNLCVSCLAAYDVRAALKEGALPGEEEFLLRALKEGALASGRALVDMTLRSMREGGGREAPVARLQAFLNTHFAENLSLEEMAAMVHLSAGYLSREFKRAAGCTVGEYVNRLRIERAKAMLRDGSMRNADIAAAVGIEDPVYFSRVFKKATGLRPTEYRASLLRRE